MLVPVGCLLFLVLNYITIKHIVGVSAHAIATRNSSGPTQLEFQSSSVGKYQLDEYHVEVIDRAIDISHKVPFVSISGYALIWFIRPEVQYPHLITTTAPAPRYYKTEVAYIHDLVKEIEINIDNGSTIAEYIYFLDKKPTPIHYYEIYEYKLLGNVICYATFLSDSSVFDFYVTHHGSITIFLFALINTFSLVFVIVRFSRVSSWQACARY
jgi:hypothetical protein